MHRGLQSQQVHAGFTLIELLVALVVFTVLGFTVTNRVSDIVNQTYGMERRTVAHWVAENYLARLRISRRGTDEPMATGTDSEQVLMAGREWRLGIDVQDTTQPWLRRVEIDVYELQSSGDEVGPVDHVVAFVGRY